MPMQLHPSPDQLRAFAQGRLAVADAPGIEEHVATCDSCCQALNAVPEDTLVQIARAAATEGVKSAEPRPKPAKEPVPAIPAELIDHLRYRVLGVVGTGGMGAVYKAEHRLMERLVALKVLNRSLVANPAAVERFLREFKAAAKLSSPYIVAAHDADTAGNLHFLVMEFVDGLSLDRLVAQQGRLTPQQAAGFVRQAALGLQHAHEKGMVHRDIKPHNLMVTKGSQIKILDFGLARLVSERIEGARQGGADDARPGETTAGMILGTPDYIAPEQVSDARTADIRADIYSLGCTLYFLLTGQPPFTKGTVMDRLASHMNVPPPALTTHRDDVPRELTRVLDKMLAKKLADRYQTPGEVAKDLLPISKGQFSTRERAPQSDDIIPLASVIRTSLATSDNVPAAEYSVLSTPAADPLPPALNLHDPLSPDADLGVSLSNLPPLIKTPVTPAFPWSNPKAVIAALAAGAALVLLVLSVTVASCGNPDGSRNLAAGQPQENAVAAKPVTRAGDSFVSPSIPPPADPFAPQQAAGRFSPPSDSTSTAAVAEPPSNLPRKVLLVIPSDSLWWNDYAYLKDAFELQSVPMEVASTRKSPIYDKDGIERTITVDRLVEPGLTAKGYGAVIFAGYTTNDYVDQGVASATTRQLIDEFLSQGKIVSSICVGQRVLAKQGVLQGKRYASCQPFNNFFRGEQRGTPSYDRIVQDGQVITTSKDEDAGALAATIAGQMAP